MQSNITTEKPHPIHDKLNSIIDLAIVLEGSNVKDMEDAEGLATVDQKLDYIKRLIKNQIRVLAKNDQIKNERRKTT